MASYTANPHENPNATLIRRVETIDDSILSIAGGAGSNRGTGGMITKIHAAQIACSKGIDMAIILRGKPRSALRYDGGQRGRHPFYRREHQMIQLGKRAKVASRGLKIASTATKNNALLAIADALCDNMEMVISANQKDIAAARSSGISEAMIDRLTLTESRIRLWRTRCARW